MPSIRLQKDKSMIQIFTTLLQKDKSNTDIFEKVITVSYQCSTIKNLSELNWEKVLHRSLFTLANTMVWM